MAAIDMNFFPEEQVKWYRKKGFYRLIVLVVFAMLLFIYFGFFKPQENKANMLNTLASLRSQMDEYMNLMDKEAVINNTVEAYNVMMQNVRTIDHGTPDSWLYIIKAVEESAHDSINITSYIYDNSKITITGVCENEQQISDLVKKLEQKSFYKGITVEKLSYGEDHITFLISGSLDWEAKIDEGN